MKKIVIASDSFKGSLSSAEVAKAAAAGVHDIFPDCEVVCLPMGDGGEGTCEAIAETLTCEWANVQTTDPLGRPIKAKYAITRAEHPTAIIELAQASGLTLLSESERDPMKTSTYGTGILIADAVERGCRKFIIGLGGSATNDGGTGMLEALGFRFVDDSCMHIRGCCGEKLSAIADIDISHVPQAILNSSFTAACDVDTPFTGPDGATRTFAPQKGADSASIEILEHGMTSLARAISRKYGLDLEHIKGTGAAGGTGGAILTFLGGSLCKGSDLVLDAAGFDEKTTGADMIITGEGKIDSQSFCGKLPSAVLKRADLKGIPVVAIGGIIDLNEIQIRESGFQSVLPIQPRPTDQASHTAAMDPDNTFRNIRQTIRDFLKK